MRLILKYVTTASSTLTDKIFPGQFSPVKKPFIAQVHIRQMMSIHTGSLGRNELKGEKTGFKIDLVRRFHEQVSHSQ